MVAWMRPYRLSIVTTNLKWLQLVKRKGPEAVVVPEAVAVPEMAERKTRRTIKERGSQDRSPGVRDTPPRPQKTVVIAITSMVRTLGTVFSL